MTKNGRAYCDSSSGTTNLRPDKITDFAVYLATVLKHFADSEGIVFNYIRAFDEPNWDWKGGQEGCRYCNYDIKQVVDALYPELRNQGLSTKIELPEAGEIKYLYGQSGMISRELTRNTGLRGYRPKRAQQKTLHRR